MEQTFQSLRREHPPLDYEGATALAGAHYKHVVDSNKKTPIPMAFSAPALLWMAISPAIGVGDSQWRPCCSRQDGSGAKALDR